MSHYASLCRARDYLAAAAKAGASLEHPDGTGRCITCLPAFSISPPADRFCGIECILKDNSGLVQYDAAQNAAAEMM